MSKRFLFVCWMLAFSGAYAQESEDERLFDVNQRFAMAGSKEGQFKLAEMYEEGRGTAMNVGKAREWYEKAAKQGHEEARRRIADWDARQAALARQREEGALAREAERKRAEQERQERLDAQKRVEEEKARLAEVKRLEAEKARQATRKREEEEKVRREAQKRPAEEKTPDPSATKEVKAQVQPGPDAAAVPPAEPAAAPLSESESFETDPCRKSTARFLSTCRGK